MEWHHFIFLFNFIVKMAKKLKYFFIKHLSNKFDCININMESHQNKMQLLQY